MIEVVDARHYETLYPSLGPALDRLRGAGLLAYPTETVYGLGCLVRSEPIARLMEAKSRDEANPMLILVTGRPMVQDLEWTEEANALADVFWPGAVTLILADRKGVFPLGIRGAGGAVGVRVSPHPVVKALLSEVGEPLVSTSVNRPGQDPAATPEEVREVLHELDLGEDITVVDAGPLPPSGASTVIDCTGPRAEVAREGKVPLARLRCVLPKIEGRP